MQLPQQKTTTIFLLQIMVTDCDMLPMHFSLSFLNCPIKHILSSTFGTTLAFQISMPKNIPFGKFLRFWPSYDFVLGFWSPLWARIKLLKKIVAIQMIKKNRRTHFVEHSKCMGNNNICFFTMTKYIYMYIYIDLLLQGVFFPSM